MPAVRATTAVRATRALQQQSASTPAAARSFTASARTPASHGPQYDPPTGWLFGIKPGEKYQKEGWETPFFYGFCGSMVIGAIAYGFKPDTSCVT
ncbi:ESSS subunit of NADH:ubiquinone oxidoreductase [Nemania sp. FL0916]|nr:ESSS subunit of NADH:ubiquinone oxidoreductase [Nemania sp. FL0916]